MYILEVCLWSLPKYVVLRDVRECKIRECNVMCEASMHCTVCHACIFSVYSMYSKCIVGIGYLDSYGYITVHTVLERIMCVYIYNICVCNYIYTLCTQTSWL
jgi:hypothetical protein